MRTYEELCAEMDRVLSEMTDDDIVADLMSFGVEFDYPLGVPSVVAGEWLGTEEATVWAADTSREPNEVVALIDMASVAANSNDLALAA